MAEVKNTKPEDELVADNIGDDGEERRLLGPDNPLYDGTAHGTMDNVVAALEWLTSLDTKVGEAFGGEPADWITHGRFLLGQCCIRALELAARDLRGAEQQAGQ